MKSAFKRAKFFLLFFGFATGLFSCQGPQENQKPTPASVATAAEQKDIDETVSEIQELALQLNLKPNFKSFPVLVIVDDPLRRDAQAFCEFKSGGGGQYIAIMRSTMAEFHMLYKPHGKNSFLFMMLVHEFGHCFYGRNHKEQVVQNSRGENVPASAMMTKSPNMLGDRNLSTETKLFYLAEVAGVKNTQFSIVTD